MCGGVADAGICGFIQDCFVAAGFKGVAFIVDENGFIGIALAVWWLSDPVLCRIAGAVIDFLEVDFALIADFWGLTNAVNFFVAVHACAFFVDFNPMIILIADALIGICIEDFGLVANFFEDALVVDEQIIIIAHACARFACPMGVGIADAVVFV